jgi:hypothetical protein
MHRLGFIALFLLATSWLRAVSFVNDVMPILAKTGCSSGGCHAKPEGQNNFKLSIFGYDPGLDYKEIVLEQRGRRLFPAAPEQSLLLLKATAAVPHEGGKRLEPGSAHYKILLQWINEGFPPPRPEEPKLKSLQVSPAAPTAKKRSKLQLQVQAKYSDASSRDVTAMSEYLSPEKDLLTVDEHGHVNVGSSAGEAAIIVRYMDQVAVAKITIPADKAQPSSAYEKLPVGHEIDKLAYARFQKLGLLPSAPCTDAEFLRRSTLDVIGQLPSAKEAREFLADRSANKRQRWVDHLLLHPRYADHWAAKWGDMLRPNPARVGLKPTLLMDRWLRDSFRQNKPWNQLVTELLTAAGSSHEQGPVAMFRDKREPEDMAGFVSQVFLGVRLECAKCHHHPSEKWSQEDYFQLAAFFGRMQRKGQGISPPISGEPEYWWPGGSGSVEHPVTAVTLTPKVPDGPEMPYADGIDSRAALAAWMTSSENPFFAKALVNRVWSALLGRGIVEPVDDFRISNPATHDAVLDWLARDFAAHGFDQKHLLRSILSSALYQQSTRPNPTNLADTKNFSRALKRRLPAEVLMDALSTLTGQPADLESLPEGARAAEVWTYSIESDFLDAFSRPNSSQECPCERDQKSSVVQALHLMNSDAVQAYLSAKRGKLALLEKKAMSEPELVQELYLTAYSRMPSRNELAEALKHFSRPGVTRQTALEDITWALLNSAEFVFNH